MVHNYELQLLLESETNHLPVVIFIFGERMPWSSSPALILHSFSFLFCFVFKFMYLFWESQRECEWGKGRDRENPKQASCGQYAEPDEGLEPVKLQDHDVSRNQELDTQLTEPLKCSSLSHSYLSFLLPSFTRMLPLFPCWPDPIFFDLPLIR